MVGLGRSDEHNLTDKIDTIVNERTSSESHDFRTVRLQRPSTTSSALASGSRCKKMLKA